MAKHFPIQRAAVIGARVMGTQKARYRIQKPEKNKRTLALLTAGKTPLLHNASAELHDIGDGIACFALTKGKMHLIDEAALDLLQQAIEKAEAEFKGMVIGHDGKHFSAGLDLHIILESAENCQWSRIEQILRQGQGCFMRIKQSKIPVVAAICGYTLGGACELAMHCAAVQAHTDTHMGLVEMDIGVIPAWGGTKESLLRAVECGGDDVGAITQRVIDAFRCIAGARKSTNADDAFAMGLLPEPLARQSSDNTAHICLNRERLLPDAKALCLQLAEGYMPKAEQIIEAPVESLHQSLEQEVTVFIQQGHPGMTPHSCNVLKMLAKTLSGHAAVKAMQRTMIEEPPRAGWDKVSELMLMQTARQAFMELVQEEEALEKIKNVLN